MRDDNAKLYSDIYLKNNAAAAKEEYVRVEVEFFYEKHKEELESLIRNEVTVLALKHALGSEERTATLTVVVVFDPFKKWFEDRIVNTFHPTNDYSVYTKHVETFLRRKLCAKEVDITVDDTVLFVDFATPGM